MPASGFRAVDIKIAAVLVFFTRRKRNITVETLQEREKFDLLKLLQLFIFFNVLCMLMPEQIMAEQLDCKKCHKYMAGKKYVHAALQMGCKACHTQPHQKNTPFPKGLSAAVPDLCYGCHDKAKFTKKNVHPPVAGGMCSGCHDPHASDNAKLLLANGADLCFMCHDKKSFSGKKIAHPPVSGGMCSSCHTPHSSDSAKLLLSEQQVLCLSCHDKTKFESKIVHPPVAGGMCTSCHFAHQGDNNKLLLSQQPELCYNCHDKAEFTKKNVHAAVLMGCTSCHNPHANKQKFLFDKTIYGLCLKCHADVTKSSHAISATGIKEGGHPLRGKRVRKTEKVEGQAEPKVTIEVTKDPARPDKEFSCASCHNPHSSDYTKLFRYKADVPFDICAYCHKM